MSHKSRVCAILVDVEKESYESAAEFWSGAVGRELSFDPNQRYAALRGEQDFLIQQTDSDRTGMHIDIETDDVEAEVVRLENLGARRRKKIKDWWVMDAPGGQAFCVVPVHSQSWPGEALAWD